MRILSKISLALLVSVSLSHALTLSGTVLNLDSTAAVGVTVTLASTGAATTTDGSGAWSLSGVSTGIKTSIPSHQQIASHLILDGNRLHLDYSGFDIMGRGIPAAMIPAHSTSLASARAASTASVDTLTYSMNGKVFLRDTVSASRSSIVRLYDTIWNAEIIYGWVPDVRDGQLYRSVAIGPQVWMAQNLNYKPSGTDSGWCYNDSIKNCKIYGRLYTNFILN
jgi:hypothetical protein